MAQYIVGSKMPANNSYGQSGSATPSSLTNVPASDRLSGVVASNPDPARDQLVKQGIRSKANDAPQEVTGQERPISDAPIPLAYGMESASKQQPSTGGMQVSRRINTPQLPAKETDNQSQPVRKT